MRYYSILKRRIFRFMLQYGMKLSGRYHGKYAYTNKQ